MATIIQRKGRWRVLIRRKGHPVQCQTFATKALAEKWARGTEAKIDAGTFVAPLDEVPISDLIQAYRDMRETARPILDSSNEHYMLKHLDQLLGEKNARTFSTNDLVQFARIRKIQGAGPYTINMEVSKLSTVWRYAGMGLGLADVVGQSRPLLNHFGLIGGGGKRTRRPTEDEFSRLVAYLLEKHYLPLYADVVVFSVASTLRRSEVCSIKWVDLDAKTRTIIVRDRKHPRKKIGNDVTVALTDMAWDVIQKQPREDERIFPVHPQTLSKYVTEACRELDIVDLHLHDMRHEGTSRLFEEGYSIPEVAAMIGGDWKNLQRYTQLTPNQTRDNGPSALPRRARPNSVSRDPDKS